MQGRGTSTWDGRTPPKLHPPPKPGHLHDTERHSDHHGAHDTPANTPRTYLFERLGSPLLRRSVTDDTSHVRAYRPDHRARPWPFLLYPPPSLPSHRNADLQDQPGMAGAVVSAPPGPSDYLKPRKTKTSEDAAAAAPAEDATMTDAKPPRGSLVIKTFDPVSGVALKYRTTKAAEVSRLITCLGALGRTMSTSKPATLDAAAATKDEPMADAGGEDTPAGAATPVEKSQAAAGGGKKKKKGKK
ncbi:hypothetical protein CNYM01_11195 [Colletotrichum nymphaeae SA-01]|uniref:SRP9 domain-containing protein n=1 Tax=Colletotrichum nymphaeae SA-01 TaxID=1460502 RepID=A0A135U4S0_9PEZI|nr:hypothetical protein CNYM01_11195 [Colletotrichum nymphaeae SA-01]